MLGLVFSLRSEDRFSGEHRSGDGAVSFQPRQFTSLCPAVHSSHAGFGITPSHLSSGVFFLRTLQFSLL